MNRKISQKNVQLAKFFRVGEEEVVSMEHKKMLTIRNCLSNKSK